MYSLGQLVFGCYIILPIKHKVDWELIRQQKQTQINKDNTPENNKRVDHDYMVRETFVINNHSAYKHETPYKGTFLITQCFTNVMVTLQSGAIKIRYYIRQIKPYASNAHFEDINPETND